VPSLEVCLPCMLDRWPHLDVGYYTHKDIRRPCPAKYTEDKAGFILPNENPPKGCYKMLEHAIDVTISEKTNA
jgi:hypothetical protein